MCGRALETEHQAPVECSHANKLWSHGRQLGLAYTRSGTLHGARMVAELNFNLVGS
jgi:hypothetical protein